MILPNTIQLSCVQTEAQESFYSSSILPKFSTSLFWDLRQTLSLWASVKIKSILYNPKVQWHGINILTLKGKTEEDKN